MSSQYPQDPGYPPPAGPSYPQQPSSFQQNVVNPMTSGGAMTPQQERSWATIAHVVPLVALVVSVGTLGFVASLVIYLMYKDRGPFVRAAAANSLNIQIMTGIGLIISALLMLVLIGFVTYPLVCLAAIVLHAIAASKANQGEWYTPPMTPSLVK